MQQTYLNKDEAMIQVESKGTGYWTVITTLIIVYSASFAI